MLPTTSAVERVRPNAAQATWPFAAYALVHALWVDYGLSRVSGPFELLLREPTGFFVGALVLTAVLYAGLLVFERLGAAAYGWCVSILLAGAMGLALSPLRWFAVTWTFAAVLTPALLSWMLARVGAVRDTRNPFTWIVLGALACYTLTGLLRLLLD